MFSGAQWYHKVHHLRSCLIHASFPYTNLRVVSPVSLLPDLTFVSPSSFLSHWTFLIPSYLLVARRSSTGPIRERYFGQPAFEDTYYYGPFSELLIIFFVRREDLTRSALNLLSDNEPSMKHISLFFLFLSACFFVMTYNKCANGSERHFLDLRDNIKYS